MSELELKNDNIEQNNQTAERITIPKEEILTSINQKLDEISKTAKIDGFRVGKVPISILKKKYWAKIRLEVLENKINDSINKIIKKNDLNLISDPVIENLVDEEGKDLEFSVKFDILPKIKVPDFTKITLEKPVCEISEKQVDEQIKILLDNSKEYDVESKLKAKKGEQVTIDAIGYVEGKAFDGGKLDSHKLVLGSNVFIPGFEDQLVGSKAGEDVVIKVSFPTEYHVKSLAGKPAEFKTHVKAVHKPRVIKDDAEIAKKFGHKNFVDFRKKVSERLHSVNDSSIHNILKISLFDHLDKFVKLDVPNSLLKKEMELLKKNYHDIGRDDESFKKKSEEEREEYIMNLANRRVKTGLILSEYIKMQKIKIDQQDINNVIMDNAKKYPGQEAQLLEFYKKNPNAVKSLEGPILEDKAVRLILDKEVTIKTKNYTAKEFEKLVDNIAD